VSGCSKKLLLAILAGLLSSGLALFFVVNSWRESRPADTPQTGGTSERAARLARLEARERTADETVWAKEILAEDSGRTIESLWDSLNAATNKLQVAGSFPVGEVVLGQLGAPQALPHGIELRTSSGPGPVLSAEAWHRFLEEFQRAGWQLEQTEFRHNRFDTDEAGKPRRSRFYFSAHLTNPAGSQRAIDLARRFKTDKDGMGIFVRYTPISLRNLCAGFRFIRYRVRRRTLSARFRA